MTGRSQSRRRRHFVQACDTPAWDERPLGTTLRRERRSRRTLRVGHSSAQLRSNARCPRPDFVPSRRSRYSGGVFSTIARCPGPCGSAGTRPPNITCSETPRASAFSTILRGSSHDGSSWLGSPIGPELNTQNGRCDSSLPCLRRNCLASPRQRPIYTALPAGRGSERRLRRRRRCSGLDSYDAVVPSRSVSPTACAISAVEPCLDA